MPPSEAAAPVGALLADPARLVAWLRARNADVGAAAARVREAQGDLGQSRLRHNPALAFSLSDVPVGATNPRGLRFADTSIYGVTLSQTLEMGKRAPRIESARLRLESDRQSYLDAVVHDTNQPRAAASRLHGVVSVCPALSIYAEEGRPIGQGAANSPKEPAHDAAVFI